MTITTVCFDVGKTLITPAVSEAQILVDAASSFGVDVDVALVEKSIPAMYEYYEDLFKNDNSIWGNDDRAIEIWMMLYEHLCDLVGISEIGPQVARLGYEKFLDPACWKLYDDVSPTLSALRAKGMSLGIISNWDSSLEAIIKGLGIKPFFEVLISSAVVGMYKPQPEIFELALRELGAVNSETLFVGDHMDADIIGAAGVGITPVLIDRENSFKDGEGYIRIQNLGDILRYL